MILFFFGSLTPFCTPQLTGKLASFQFHHQHNSELCLNCSVCLVYNPGDMDLVYSSCLWLFNCTLYSFIKRFDPSVFNRAPNVFSHAGRNDLFLKLSACYMYELVSGVYEKFTAAKQKGNASDVQIEGYSSTHCFHRLESPRISFCV